MQKQERFRGATDAESQTLERGSEERLACGSSGLSRPQTPSTGEARPSNGRPRSALKIFLDILDIVRGEGASSRAKIMRVVNVSSGRLETYLDELVSQGLLKECQGRGSTYALTMRGLDFVIQVKAAEAYVATFGLGI